MTDQEFLLLGAWLCYPRLCIKPRTVIDGRLQDGQCWIEGEQQWKGVIAVGTPKHIQAVKDATQHTSRSSEQIGFMFV